MNEQTPHTKILVLKRGGTQSEADAVQRTLALDLIAGSRYTHEC